MTIPVAIARRPEVSYDIVIGRGGLAELEPLLARHCPAARYVVITDSRVAELYGRALARRLDAALLDFPAGEWNKTRDTWAALSDRMLAARLGRDAAVIALGGGVVGDVAGFVAATYLRGIPYVALPTTLLAMIDSSIGGKTSVDTPVGKNLIGAFHQPRLVLADLDVLRSLAPVQLAAGMAEAVKHGVIADEEYFTLLEQEHQAVRARDLDVLTRVVERSVEIKAAVVAADERELGRRAILNFGHTVAHAIEATAQFAVLHGEAVAVGMAYESRLAEALGIALPGTAKRIAAVLKRYELPLDLPDAATVDTLLAAMQFDKKARDGTVRFALPRGIGAMHGDAQHGWTVTAPESAVRAALTTGGGP